MKRLSLLFVFLMAGIALQAQSLPFGYINSSELIALMPERDSTMVKLQKYAADLDETLQEMQTELQSKYNTYQQKQATWSASVLGNKQRELQDLQQRLEQYNQNAQQEMQQMQQALFQPVVEKANKAISKVAKEKGLLFVFDLASGAVAYYDAEKGLNLLPLCKEELGIPVDKVAPAQLGTPENK